jgi:hypothetical protein
VVGAFERDGGSFMAAQRAARGHSSFAIGWSSTACVTRVDNRATTARLAQVANTSPSAVQALL